MGAERVKTEALQIIGMFQILPKLVVFDLDHTLWPFYCDRRSKLEMPSMYPHANGILHAFKEKGVDVAIASRASTADTAKTFLDKLSITSIFVAKEIYSSWTHKTDHFQKIHTKTGVPYSSMLFFDDEDRNINSISKMGVTSILVDDGVNLGALRHGLTEYTKNVETSANNKERWNKKCAGNSSSSSEKKVKE